MPSDIENLQGVLLGLGLKELPKLLVSLHKARHLGRNVDRGKTPEGTNLDEAELQSLLAPLLQQATAGQLPPQPESAPPSGPGMRVGMRPPSTPPMPSIPRFLPASAANVSG